jgi:hypothetical protein
MRSGKTRFSSLAMQAGTDASGQSEQAAPAQTDAKTLGWRAPTFLQGSAARSAKRM